MKTSKKTRYIVATPDKKSYYKITEWESDMTGYGGSTTTEYKYETTEDINEASIFNKDPTHIMHRYNEKYWKPFTILKIKEVIKLRLINE